MYSLVQEYDTICFHLGADITLASHWLKVYSDHIVVREISTHCYHLAADVKLDSYWSKVNNAYILGISSWIFG